MRPLLFPLLALTLGLSACTKSEPSPDAAGALNQLPGAVKGWNPPTSPKVTPPIEDHKAGVKPTKLPGATQEWNSPTSPKLPGATQEWNPPTSPKAGTTAAGLDGL